MPSPAVTDQLTSQADGKAAAQGSSKQKGLVVPFTRAATPHVEPFEDRSTLLTASAFDVASIDVPAYGYLRHIVVEVVASGGVASGTNAVAAGDAPWNVLSSISLHDVNGVPLVGPLSGYELMLANKYGGYSFDADPTKSPVYSAMDAGGNFSFLLRIPVEIAQRDALGALPNTNAAATYKVGYTLAPTTQLYSTAPAGTKPTVRVRMWLEAWSQPAGTDLRGLPQAQTPVAMGTTQFWSRQVVNIASGEQMPKLTRVGNHFRNLIFVLRDTSGVRTTSNWPDPWRFIFDTTPLLNVSRALSRHYVAEQYGYDAADLDAGVFVLPFTADLDYHPGNELRDHYLATTQASRIELAGSFGAAGTLTILTNDVAGAGDIYA